MAEATNAQMQAYADQRVRVRAEQFRDLFLACADDKSAIDDVFARAAGTNAWADARTDGPPHLLQSANSVNPDDMLNFNALISLMAKLQTGTFASQAEANGFAAQLTVLLRACVRPVNR